MDSLRRLTSSVFDGGGSSHRLGRRHSGSGLSAFPFLPLGAGDPLELTYVTEQLVVCGFPVATATNRKANTVNVDELAHALETRHSGHYLVFNLNALDEQPSSGSGGCASPAASTSTSSVTVAPSLMEQLWKKAAPAPPAALDAQAIAEKLREQMLEFSWERDGMKAHTPPFDLVFRICYSLFAWLSLDAANVAVVHCQSGKTRSGVVVACYLLFARLADDPIDAFVAFYRQRWDMRALTPQALCSKTPPSIQRFLASFHELVEGQKPPNDAPMLLKAIIFRALPVELRPCVQIWDDYQLVFSTDDAVVTGGTGTSKDPPVIDWSGDDGFLAILWETGIELDGGFSILCSFGDEYDSNGDDVDASSRVLFRYADSTWFLHAGLVTLTKRQLDMMKQYEHGFDDDHFSVDLVLHENSNAAATAARRQHVRLDYTGNNAVRQGLIEVTKHHRVLPDPAMHSNFLRMGFGETPTTFALQRSQNTPNAALDLLHSEGLAACFAKESPGKPAVAIGGAPPTTLSPMPAGEPTRNPTDLALRRQTTAEIVAMQSQRSRYATPTGADASICRVCNDDDYMMRPQIVCCTGACGGFYHTTCVGLRKIPFGLTTLSDRTNHSVYVKKFFSAWECDTCAPPPVAVRSASSPAIEVPVGMTLVPSAWASSYVSSATVSSSVVTTLEADNKLSLATNGARSSGEVAAPAQVSRLMATTTQAPSFSESATHMLAAIHHDGDSATEELDSEAAKLDKLRDFLLASGVSVEDLLRAATTPNVSIAPTPSKDQRDGTSAASAAVFESFRAQSDSSGIDSVSVQTAALQVEEEDDTTEGDEGKPPHKKSASLPPAKSSSKSVELQPPSPHTRPAQPPTVSASSNDRVATSNDTATTATLAPTATPLASGLQSALLSDIAAKRTSKEGTDDDQAANSVERSVGVPTLDGVERSAGATDKYARMLTRGVPFEAVQNCMVRDGADPSTLCRQAQQADTMNNESPAAQEPLLFPDASVKQRLKDVEEFRSYFSMLRLGCPKDAVKHKLVMDGLDPIVVDLGPDAIYDDVKHKITVVLPPEDRSRLQDDIQCVREPRSQRTLVVSETLPSPTEAAKPTTASDVLLRDHDVYAKYFRMLKMGLPEDAVRHKMRSEGADERALDLGGDVPFSTLSASAPVAAKLGDDPVYAKYFKMLQMGLPDGAVRHKMATDGVDGRALDLGPDALVTELVTGASGGAGPVVAGHAKAKPTQRRKKLHWQAISDDRLSGLNQQTIWEDKGDDDVDFDMDMDELESLFFSNNDATATSSSASSKKKTGPPAKALKRKQSVTLVDGKRAMNAAISLARVRLSYSAIADAVASFDASGLSLQQLIGINEFLPTPDEVAVVSAYSGDVAMLGEVRPTLLCDRLAGELTDWLAD